MERRTFGATAQTVSVIGQGTWNLEQADHAEAVAALRHGLDLGMTHVDTAEMYGAGESERLVGEAIAGRRDDVFLVSKALPHNATRAGLVAACDKSLARLRTDRLDCYLLHWRGNVPLAETIAGFEALLAAGKIRTWGVSNFDVDDLEAAAAIAGAGRIACNQVLYHLRERAIEHAVIPWCEARGVAVTAYSPFGQQRFVDPRSPGGQLLADIARAHGATPRAVALAFLTRNPAVFAIPKASRLDHVAQNATEVRLDAAEIERIDRAFPPGAKGRSLPML